MTDAQMHNFILYLENKIEKKLKDSGVDIINKDGKLFARIKFNEDYMEGIQDALKALSDSLSVW